MFHMANDSALFEARPNERCVRLYEAKLMHQFDHRHTTYEGASEVQQRSGILPQLPPEKKRDPDIRVQPRYWIARHQVERQLAANWTDPWLLALRRLGRNYDERTMISSILPREGVGDNAVLVFPSAGNIPRVSALLALLNSLTFDYVVRQKLSSAALSHFILKQLPVPPPWAWTVAEVEWVTRCVMELVYTAWDIKPFADSIWRYSDESLRQLVRRQSEDNKAATGGHEWNPPEWAEIAEDGIPLPPFKWDDGRRARIRAELDAYYALLYGLTRDELRYILDPKDVYGSDFPGETFRVLKEKEEKLYGEYRTRRLVMEAFDKLAESPRFRDEMPNRTSALEIPGKAG